MSIYTCPFCKADLRGEAIPEKDRIYYSKPYYYSRAIGIELDNDRVEYWQCPDCGVRWDALTGGEGRAMNRKKTKASKEMVSAWTKAEQKYIKESNGFYVLPCSENVRKLIEAYNKANREWYERILSKTFKFNKSPKKKRKNA